MAITKVSPDLLDLDAGITITTTDNSDNLTLTSTDADAAVGPNLVLYRNSSSPADSDLLGQLKIVGRNDNSQDVNAVLMQNYMTDVSDGSEDAASFFYVMAGGSVRERLGFTSSAIVFNEDSQDVDFRIESDDNANMFFVDGGNDRVGIGTASPGYELHVEDDASEATIAVRSNIGGTGSAVGGRLRLQLGAQNNSGSGQADSQSGDTLGQVLFEGQGTDYSYQGGSIATIVTTGDGTATRSEQATAMTFGTMSAGAVSYAERMRILDNGGITFNGDTAAANALDDYEVGTWTPTITGSTTNPVYGTSTAVGDYVKIGNIVHATFLIVVTSVSNVGAGNKQISGLPVAQNQAGYQQVGLIGYNDVFGDDVGSFYATGTALQIIPGGVTQSNYGGDVTTGYLSGQITYQVS